jgi:hypothetical protein
MKRLKHEPIRKQRHKAKYQLQKAIQDCEEELVDLPVSQSRREEIPGLPVQESDRRYSGGL